MNSPCLLISCLFLFYKETFFRSETEREKEFSLSLNNVQLWWETRKKKFQTHYSSLKTTRKSNMYFHQSRKNCFKCSKPTQTFGISKATSAWLCNSWEAGAHLEHRCVDMNSRYQQQLDTLPAASHEKQMWSSLESINDSSCLQGEPSHPPETEQQNRQETTPNPSMSP